MYVRIMYFYVIIIKMHIFFMIFDKVQVHFRIQIHNFEFQNRILADTDPEHFLGNYSQSLKSKIQYG
jgi:hypothetical protein